ncbi:unnamed protein product [Lepeophtheirus salmonis]|uniref:(salmon louse) hypothetical protein n=1 Tax=Lepeophtheirus salmonis TaxID=72036 RepID=A0A7R8HDF7_LEPSM|nr:unnamed protein product [Lepeophtheirus salmonis]CAF3008376.1 unnamed protein product [Lepeophtheirus salmonis]
MKKLFVPFIYFGLPWDFQEEKEAIFPPQEYPKGFMGAQKIRGFRLGVWTLLNFDDVSQSASSMEFGFSTKMLTITNTTLEDAHSTVGERITRSPRSDSSIGAFSSIRLFWS